MSKCLVCFQLSIRSFAYERTALPPRTTPDTSPETPRNRGVSANTHHLLPATVLGKFTEMVMHCDEILVHFCCYPLTGRVCVCFVQLTQGNGSAHAAKVGRRPTSVPTGTGTRTGSDPPLGSAYEWYLQKRFYIFFYCKIVCLPRAIPVFGGNYSLNNEIVQPTSPRYSKNKKFSQKTWILETE